MKVLWLCNIMLPFIAKSLGHKIVVKEGWLSGLASKLMQNQENNNITLAICFPSSDDFKLVEGDDSLFVKNSVKGVAYYVFREDTIHPENYDASMEESLSAIVKDFEPEIVHIFGTEYPHTLAMTKAFARPERTLIGIQGLCGEIAEVYMADLPVAVQKKKTFRDILKKDGLLEQQQKFVHRGENEKQALALTGHVTGRTDFDKEMTQKLAPQAKYHFMNETLRDELNLNIEKLKERARDENNFKIQETILPAQTIYRQTMHTSSLENKKNILRNTVFDAMKKYGSDTSKRMFFIEYPLDDPDCISYCAAILPEKQDENTCYLPQEKALCIFYYGSYESLPDAREKIIAYAKENGIALKNRCRHIYLEGPPQHKDPEKFITQVAVLIK